MIHCNSVPRPTSAEVPSVKEFNPAEYAQRTREFQRAHKLFGNDIRSVARCRVQATYEQRQAAQAQKTLIECISELQTLLGDAREVSGCKDVNTMRAMERQLPMLSTRINEGIQECNKKQSVFDRTQTALQAAEDRLDARSCLLRNFLSEIAETYNLRECSDGASEGINTHASGVTTILDAPDETVDTRHPSLQAYYESVADVRIIEERVVELEFMLKEELRQRDFQREQDFEFDTTDDDVRKGYQQDIAKQKGALDQAWREVKSAEAKCVEQGLGFEAALEPLLRPEGWADEDFVSVQPNLSQQSESRKDSGQHTHLSRRSFESQKMPPTRTRGHDHDAEEVKSWLETLPADFPESHCDDGTDEPTASLGRENSFHNTCHCCHLATTQSGHGRRGLRKTQSDIVLRAGPTGPPSTLGADTSISANH